LVRPGRLLVEGCICVLVLVCVLAVYACTHVSEACSLISRSPAREPIAIASTMTGLFWSVSPDNGTLRLAEAAGGSSELERREQSFRLEWGASGKYFCLRWLGDLRLVEVAVPPAGGASTLHVGRIRCDHRSQHFQMRGSSLYNVGGLSFVDMRVLGALGKESIRTRVQLVSLPELHDEFEHRALELLANATEGRPPQARAV